MIRPLLATAALATIPLAAETPPFQVDPTPLPASEEAEMLARVTPAIVSVFPGRLARSAEGDADSPASPMDRYFRPDQNDDGEPSVEGVGSGVIVSADGLIVTNHHVVTLRSGNTADAITIELTDKRRFPAKLVGSDRLTDLALLKIEAGGLPALSFADSTRLRVGDPVFAVGNPFRVGLTVTKGIVSALDRSGLNIGGSNSFEGFIQTDAPINPGNSGGALTDVRGRLVGINTAIFSQSGGNVGIGFSVPSNLVREIATRLLADGRITRGFFGARSESVDQARAETAGLPAIAGVHLAEVIEGGPAANAGWRAGDVITAIDGRPVADRGAFRLILSLAKPGETVTCSGYRDGNAVEFPVTLGGGESQAAGEFEIASIPGLRLKPADGGLAVVSIAADSPAARKLKPGQTILKMNGEPAGSAANFENAIRKGVNTLTVLAGGRETTVILRLE